MRRFCVVFGLLMMALWSVHARAASLKPVVWSCLVQCGSSGRAAGTLFPVYYHVCAKTVLDPNMFADATALCREANHRDDVHAVSMSKSLLVSECSSAGHACDHEGRAFVTYVCKALCPGERVPREYGTCADNDASAWKVASTVCEGARPPPSMRSSSVCSAVSAIPCTP